MNKEIKAIYDSLINKRKNAIDDNANYFELLEEIYLDDNFKIDLETMKLILDIHNLIENEAGLTFSGGLFDDLISDANLEGDFPYGSELLDYEINEEAAESLSLKLLLFQEYGAYLKNDSLSSFPITYDLLLKKCKTFDYSSVSLSEAQIIKELLSQDKINLLEDQIEQITSILDSHSRKLEARKALSKQKKNCERIAIGDTFALPVDDYFFYYASDRAPFWRPYSNCI